MWQDRQVWLHGDATPANFLFGHGMDVAAIDLERMKRGDRMFDVGRVAGELQHAFMTCRRRRHRAEPFIGHFLWEYSCHFPDRERTFESVTARAPYYMALNLLRIARNDYIDRETTAEGWCGRRRSCCELPEGRYGRDDRIGLLGRCRHGHPSGRVRRERHPGQRS